MSQNFAEIFENSGDTQPTVSEYLEIEDSKTSDSEETPIETGDNAEIKTEESSTDNSEGDKAKVEESESNLPEEEKDLSKEELQQILDDPKTPKWFRNKLSREMDKFGKYETDFQTYSQFGTPDEIKAKLESSGGYNFRGTKEVDGQQFSIAADEALRLLNEDSSTAFDVIEALCGAPNPANPEETIFDALIQSPEVQEYLKEQFQIDTQAISKESVPDDPLLKDIEPELHEAFNRLSKEEKDDFKFASDATRQKMLEKENKLLQADKAELQRETTLKLEKEQAFNQQIENVTVENFDTVRNQFSESLTQIPFSPDTQLNSFLQSTVEKLVVDAAVLQGSPTGDSAVAALKHLGVEFPKDVPELVKELETKSRQIVEFRRDKKDVTELVSDLATVQRKLVGSSNEISASIALAFSGDAKNQAELKGNLLGNPTRPGIKPTGGTPTGDGDDVSSLSYRDIVKNGKNQTV